MDDKEKLFKECSLNKKLKHRIWNTYEEEIRNSDLSDDELEESIIKRERGSILGFILLRFAIKIFIRRMIKIIRRR